MEASLNLEGSSWADTMGTTVDTQCMGYPQSDIELRGSQNTPSLIDPKPANVPPHLDDINLFAPTTGASRQGNGSSFVSTPVDTYPASTASSSCGHSQPEPSHKIQKRKRNTEAARRYRQRKDDKTTELEAALKVMTQERDHLNLKLARAEAEASVLRSMLAKP